MAETEPLRVAVVGLGIGRMHVLAFKQLRRQFQVVAVCDVDGARATEVAGWLRDVRAVTDPAEIFAADDIEVVDLCTPPGQHRVQIETGLRAGKDIICEKPLVGSLREVDELLAVEQETGRRVMPILQYRFGRGIQRLRRLVELGITGRPYVANVELAWWRDDTYYAVPWRGRWATELGGVLLSHALHALDMTTFILGQPSAVWARTATLVNDIEVEDSAAAVMRFPHGGLATLSATLGSVAEISRHRFTFERLSAESNTEAYANGAEPWTITPLDVETAAAIDEATGQPGSAGEDYVGQLERYATARAEGLDPPVTLADARAVLELVTGLYVSSREDREVPLPLTPADRAYQGWAP